MIKQRIKDLTAELNHKLALWLCHNNSVVLLPKFNTREISRSKGLLAGKRRSIGRNSVRKLAQISSPSRSASSSCTKPASSAHG